MKVFHNIAPNDFKHYDTQKIRDALLIEKLFEKDKIAVNYSHIDRMMILGAMPVNQTLTLSDFIEKKALGTNSFLERRELGVINIGGQGKIFIDNEEFVLNTEDGAYFGKEAGELSFSSVDSKNPAKFYMLSAPAHQIFPSRVVRKEQAIQIEAGSESDANKRTIRQYLHVDVLPTCQLCLGVTSLAQGSVWNTMPAHTHERRMEVYFYFNMQPEQVVFHFIGEPTETRHIVLQNEHAIASPSWSIHSGCGTSNYQFIWGMAGENQTYTDMDFIQSKNLK